MDQLTGSSPLTRGKCLGKTVEAIDRGLIPAHAGKMPIPAVDTRTTEAHPRSRGENVYVDVVPSMRGGSSPLTRGKSLQATAVVIAGRLIPAHAGKIVHEAVHECFEGAHPRSRGENSAWCGAFQVWGGSSPLTRGKYLHLTVRKFWAGLIPAHAGKILPDLRFYRADRSDLGKP